MNHRSGRPASENRATAKAIPPTVSTGQNDPTVITHESRRIVLALAGAANSAEANV
jgi:hypothetical protein